MVRRRAKSELDKALRQHAGDETTVPAEFVDLPGGIRQGVARLVEARVGTYAKGPNIGEKFLYVAGAVHEPETASNVEKVFKDGKVQVLRSGEMRVRGLRTSQMFPLCETKTAGGKVTSCSDNVNVALNHMRLLGGEGFTADVTSISDLEELCEALKEAKPFFKFGTNAGEPTADYPDSPRVWHNWYGTGGLEDYDPEVGDEVVDETEEGEIEEEEEEQAEEEYEEEEGDDEEEEELEDEDLQTLGEAADEGDADAIARLEGQAKLFGISQKQINNADTYVDVANMIEEASKEDEGDEEDEQDLEDEEEEEEQEDDWQPEVGEAYPYKPPRSRKTYECTVKTVNVSKQTCSLENDEGKVYRNVSWSELE